MPTALECRNHVHSDTLSLILFWIFFKSFMHSSITLNSSLLLIKTSWRKIQERFSVRNIKFDSLYVIHTKCTMIKHNKYNDGFVRRHYRSCQIYMHTCLGQNFVPITWMTSKWVSSNRTLRQCNLFRQKEYWWRPHLDVTMKNVWCLQNLTFAV